MKDLEIQITDNKEMINALYNMVMILRKMIVNNEEQLDLSFELLDKVMDKLK